MTLRHPGVAERLIGFGRPDADACRMTFLHDPRPASRYQAVTQSVFRAAMRSQEPRVGAQPVAAPRTRVLRHVRTQLVHLAFPG
jgi:hypothetical protein